MKMKTLIASSVLAASTVASSVAIAESPLTANIGVTSNYIWRGMPQSLDSAEIQGGIDYAHESGIYVGTWVSSLLATQYEMDFYGGFAFDAGPVGLDVGYIMYTYPIADWQSDFSEAYLNASIEWFSAGVALTVDTDWGGDDSDLYYYVAADFDIKDGLMLGLLYGNTDYDDAASEDLAHYQVSLSKDDFTFALDQLDATDTGAGEDDMRFSVSWSKSFDL